MQNFIMVLDTEGYSNRNVYNLGYAIINAETLEIVKTDSLALLPALWENLKEKLKRSLDNPQNVKLSNMCLTNFEDILTDSGKKYKVIRSENGLFKHFLRLFKMWNIKDLYAFNVAFDRGALKRTFTEYHYNILFKNVNFHDIQTAVFYEFCYNMDYVQFCVANNYLTKKGFCQCKAETFYRFLHNDINFIEEHKALDDVIIESEMLIEVLKKNPNPKTHITRPYLLLNELYDKDNSETITDLVMSYIFIE